MKKQEWIKNNQDIKRRLMTDAYIEVKAEFVNADKPILGEEGGQWDDTFSKEVNRRAKLKLDEEYEVHNDQDTKQIIFKSERHLEEYFVRAVKAAGGWAVKFNPLGTIGLPDRIVFFESQSWLVELKTPKGTVKPHQKSVHKLFKDHGFNTRIVRNKVHVADFIFDMINHIA